MMKRDIKRLCRLLLCLAAVLSVAGCRTCRDAESGADGASARQVVDAVIAKLRGTVIPEMSFYSPATIADAVDFLSGASRDYDKPGTPPDRRGVVFDLRLPRSGGVTNAPVIPALSVRNVSLYDALNIVCEATGMTWRIFGDDGRISIASKGAFLDEDWASRSFNIPPELSARLFEHPASGDPDKVWKNFFEQLGVTGPGSDETTFLSADVIRDEDFSSKSAWFTCLPTIGKLCVKNTLGNLAVIQAVFDTFAPRMVEVEVQVHAFRSADIERLRLSGGVSVETLTALRRQGKSRPVASASALTKPGLEAVVKAVREVLYPTELDVDGGLTGSSGTALSAAGALTPVSFETREVGMTLQAVPDVAIDQSTVSLMLNPQWVTLDGWEIYPADLAAGRTHRTLPFRQPVFGVTSFQTQVTVRDGGTVLLGSSSTPDGEWVQAGFLTVRLRAVEAERAERETVSPKREDPGAASVKQKMNEIVIPEMAFRPPATIIDAVKFFAQASRDFDRPEIPAALRGIDFVLKLPQGLPVPVEGEGPDPFAAPSAAPSANAAPVIQAIGVRFISLYDAVKLVCDITGMKVRIRDGIVWLVPQAEPDGEWVTRFYPVLPHLYDGIRIADGSRDDDSVQDQNVFFESMGVKWPSGSSIRYLASIGWWRVTNTPENLETFEQVYDDLAVRPRMIEVDMQIHAFRPADIERLRLSGGVSAEALTALRRKGKSSPVASASVLTRSGQEALMRAVREMLYPTELDGTSTGTVPCVFELREAGMILQAVPEVSAEGGAINIMLNPQWVTLDGWETYAADAVGGRTHRTLPFRQPVFGVTSFQTQVTVEDGGTVLLGSCSTPDGEWVHVGFLTAKRMDVHAEEKGTGP